MLCNAAKPYVVARNAFMGCAILTGICGGIGNVSEGLFEDFFIAHDDF